MLMAPDAFAAQVWLHFSQKDNGCDFVQFDEPVLTEIIMSEECERRTFM